MNALIGRGLVALLVLSTFAGCTESSPLPASPTPTPPGPTSPAPSVSGIVYETTPGGRRPLPGVRLLVFVRSRGLGTNGTSVLSDIEGRYQVPGGLVVENGTAGVYAFDGAGFFRHQPCVAQTVVKGATVLDVEYNPREVPGSAGSPTVSGRIFMETSAGRQPVTDREVAYYASSTLAASTYTNADGHYAFCNVPLGAGQVSVYDPLDYDRGTAAETPVNVAGDLVLDIEIAR